MSRIIIIDSCTKCPYITFEYRETKQKGVFICTYNDNELEFILGIPQDCPLKKLGESYD